MSLQCIVVTPEATVCDQPADFVALPLFDGEIGVMPGRAPMIGRLGYGELRINRGGETTCLYVDGGFVEVLGNIVSVLTNRAMPAASLDAEVAAEHLDAARRKRANTPELFELRERSESQARAQLHMARRHAG